MDDPPRHPIEELALQLHEMQTRGREPEPPSTLVGEITKLATAENWTAIYDYPGGQIDLLERPIEKQCPACKGRGREPTLILAPLQIEVGSMCIEKLCERCKGLSLIHI